MNKFLIILASTLLIVAGYAAIATLGNVGVLLVVTVACVGVRFAPGLLIRRSLARRVQAFARSRGLNCEGRTAEGQLDGVPVRLWCTTRRRRTRLGMRPIVFSGYAAGFERRAMPEVHVEKRSLGGQLLRPFERGVKVGIEELDRTYAFDGPDAEAIRLWASRPHVREIFRQFAGYDVKVHISPGLIEIETSGLHLDWGLKNVVWAAETLGPKW